MKRKTLRAGLSYRERSESLGSLGFASYEAYLASGLWAAIRKRVLARDGERCRLCGKPASQVHHTSYVRAALSGKAIHLLAAICGGCHLHIEFDRDGSKRPPAEVGEMYRRARRRFKAARWCEENDPLTAEFRAIVRGT